MSPFRPDLVDCWVFRVVHSARDVPSTEVLLLRRAQGRILPGLWQCVSGSLEADDRVAIGALRELHEETGYGPSGIEAFYDLKHEVMTLKHAVGPLMEVAGKLYGGRVPALCGGLGEYFRDVYDHLHRVNTAVEQMREMLQTAISVSFTLINLSESETTKRLAAWGALITIPTLLIMSGHATLFIGEEDVELTGYAVIPASAGRKQAIYAHADTLLTMLFPTAARTVEEAEQEFTDEPERLGSRRAPNHVHPRRRRQTQ